MARRPIDEGLFIDQRWRFKRDPTRVIVITMIHRKDRQIEYYKWGPKIVKRLAAKQLLAIKTLRANYEPMDIYIK